MREYRMFSRMDMNGQVAAHLDVVRFSEQNWSQIEAAAMDLGDHGNVEGLPRAFVMAASAFLARQHGGSRRATVRTVRIHGRTRYARVPTHHKYALA